MLGAWGKSSGAAPWWEGATYFQVMDNSRLTFFGLSIRSQRQRRWLAFRLWRAKSDPRKIFLRCPPQRPKKEAILSDDFFPQCHGLPESRAPEGRHQPCPIIVPRCCCAVKSQFCMALSLDYICPPGQPQAFVPHCDDYALHPQLALRSPEPPTGAAGRGGAGGHTDDYARGARR